MRILYDHQIFSLQKYGGISRCFVELYRHMPASCQAMIAVRESDNVYARELEGVRPLGYQYDHFICHRHFFGKGHLHQWYDRLTGGGYYPDYNEHNTIELLKKGEFDVFHPTYFSDYFLPYLNGKPFVLTIHDMIPELYPQFFAKDDPQIVMKRKLAPLASAIIAVSEHTKQDIIRILNVPEEKIFVVYHGCSFPKGGEGVNYDFPYILFVGQRGLYKNFLPFVKAVIPTLRRHEDLHVVCTGSPFNEEEQTVISGYDLQERFHASLVKDDSELFALYHHAQCFVYPSEYEGFGIPILEAYQAACPVLLNHASCFPEIAGDAAIYFRMDKDGSDLAEKLESLLSMATDERRSLIERQTARLKNYSWENSARQLATIYETVSHHSQLQ